MKIIGYSLTAALLLGVLGGADARAATNGGTQANNNQPTTKYQDTLVLAQLRLDIDKATDEVHFIRDSNDPYILTKVYVLKHADPYELRPFLRTVVEGKRVTPDVTFVACIKYNNGEGILIVSAEDYRFQDNENGMGIDTIVKTLDQPNVTSSSGQVRLMYFPMYRSAEQLADMVTNVGANVKGDATELLEGKDKVLYDAGLNCLFLYTPRYSIKNIQGMLQYYDTPIPETQISYKVYEIYAENDADIGADFLAWKNNGGADLFSAGGRYRNNWGSTWDSGVNKSEYSKSQYVNFNPKWNSRYLDFLASKSKAQILTSGSLTVKNGNVGTIEKRTNMFNVERGDKIPDAVFDQDIVLTSKTLVTSGTSAAAAVKDQYRIQAYDSDGTRIDFSASGFKATFTALKIQTNSGVTQYFMVLQDTANHFVKDGADLGSSTNCYGLTVEKCVEYIDEASNYKYKWEAQAWKDDASMTVYKNTQFLLKGNAKGYGFKIALSPSVCEDATILNVEMVNDSLVGWDSSGAARVARDNTVKTKVMLSNSGTSFVVGGLEKRNVVRSVTGAPYLRNLPFLGWLFSTESESTKRSRLVLVAESRSMLPDTAVKQGMLDDVMKVGKKLKNAGDKNTFGFGQVYADKALGGNN